MRFLIQKDKLQGGEDAAPSIGNIQVISQMVYAATAQEEKMIHIVLTILHEHGPAELIMPLLHLVGVI